MFADIATLVQEKVNQAISLLQEKDIDMWLTFVRETPAAGDPILPLLYSLDLSWQSALILTRRGERIAIVGRYEAEAARSVGAYTLIIDYDQSIRSILVNTIEKIKPRKPTMKWDFLLGGHNANYH